MKTITVSSLDKNTEDEVIISSGIKDIICFCPEGLGDISIGKSYPATLRINEYDTTEVNNETEESIEKLSDWYEYKITGTLSKGRLESCGFEFEDWLFSDELQHLDGQKISIIVDRIDISFSR